MRETKDYVTGGSSEEAGSNSIGGYRMMSDDGCDNACNAVRMLYLEVTAPILEEKEDGQEGKQKFYVTRQDMRAIKAGMGETKRLVMA